MKTYRRMPNGEVTISTKKYYKAWDEITKPIEKTFNIQLHALDPDVQFISPVWGFIHMPLGFAKQLVELINIRKEE